MNFGRNLRSQYVVPRGYDSTATKNQGTTCNLERLGLPRPSTRFAPHRQNYSSLRKAEQENSPRNRPQTAGVCLSINRSWWIDALFGVLSPMDSDNGRKTSLRSASPNDFPVINAVDSKGTDLAAFVSLSQDPIPLWEHVFADPSTKFPPNS